MRSLVIGQVAAAVQYRAVAARIHVQAHGI